MNKFSMSLKNINLATSTDLDQCIRQLVALYDSSMNGGFFVFEDGLWIKYNTWKFHPYIKKLDDTHSNALDAAGIEWNPEIHSARKTKTVDGLWRARRHSSNGEEIDEPQSDFQKLMNFIVNNSEIITPAYLFKVLSEFDLTHVVQLQHFPDKIPTIMEIFQYKVNNL